MDGFPIAIGTLLFNEVELLDFTGPYEVFSMANDVVSLRGRQEVPFSLVTIAEKLQPVTTRGGLRVLPDYSLETCPSIQILVVPGGVGTRRERQNEMLIKWIATQSNKCRQVVSVCTGAMLLARAGLLTGRRATTHWAALDDLSRCYPEVTFVHGERVVDSGSVITAAGVAAGIDLGLYLVGRYLGEEMARITAERMEYVPIKRGDPGSI